MVTAVMLSLEQEERIEGRLRMKEEIERMEKSRENKSAPTGGERYLGEGKKLRRTCKRSAFERIFPVPR